MISIRLAEKKDISEILTIYNDIILNTTAVYEYQPQTLAMRKAWFDTKLKDGYPVFVAEQDGKIMGFCDLIPSRDKDADPWAVAEIEAIYILPPHWRTGAGRALCKSTLTTARGQDYQAVTLWVLTSNDAARRFYEAMGFRLDGTAKTGRMVDGSELHEIRFRISLQTP